LHHKLPQCGLKSKFLINSHSQVKGFGSPCAALVPSINKVGLAGGYSGSTDISKAFLYDVQTQLWTQLPDMTTGQLVGQHLL
jgi:hypothetical protein